MYQYKKSCPSLQNQMFVYLNMNLNSGSLVNSRLEKNFQVSIIYLFIFFILYLQRD